MQDPSPVGFESWRVLARFILYFFSVRPLAKSLFSGWHRDTSPERTWWERLILNGTIIGIGAIIRLMVIALGLFALLLSVLLLPVFLLLPIRLSYERLIRVGSIGKTWAYGSTPTLRKYGLLLYKGREVKLYGREETVALVTRVLSREEKDNVILVGPPGVGKETILAQFAKDMYRGFVPEKLKNRQVVEVPVADVPLDMLKRMFGEAQSAGNIIAVLREPEKYQGMLDEILPLLRAAELQVIVETTFENYVGFWRGRADILRYFERVDVPPLSGPATLEFLGDFIRERHPDLRIKQGALEEIVLRTDELIQTKPQPEKSLDLLEELITTTRDVTIDAVDAILSQKTGVPLGAIGRDEQQVLLTLEAALEAEIVGQEEAIRAIASALRRSRTAVASKSKPVGSFLFLGPTGSGKTHTAKMLAKHYFGGEGVMSRFDMSEFALPESEPAFVERLALAVTERPYSLVFFDELEKAERTIWQTLLQVLDEGRLTTRSGATVSFKNTIIIATSNAGTAYIEAHPGTTRDALMKMLIEERLFSPEFLNRFDDIVLFHPLMPEDAAAVARLLLTELNERLMRERGVSVEITPTLVGSLLARGFDPANGARALRRAVQDMVENAVADAILRGQAEPGSKLVIG